MKKNLLKKWIVFFLLIICIFSILLFLIFYRQILNKVGSFLIIEDELMPVDVIHVIAGEDYRSEYAIDLYQLGLTKYIFFTGGWCKYHGYYHGAHGKELALYEGVPEEAIIYDDSVVKSTYDEILLLNHWVENNPENIKSIMIVSDPFHMRRAKWVTTKILGGDKHVLMAPVPFNQENLVENWWKEEISRKFVFDEYIKIIYYFFRYQLSINWLARFDTE